MMHINNLVQWRTEISVFLRWVARHRCLWNDKPRIVQCYLRENSRGFDLHMPPLLLERSALLVQRPVSIQFSWHLRRRGSTTSWCCVCNEPAEKTVRHCLMVVSNDSDSRAPTNTTYAKGCDKYWPILDLKQLHFMLDDVGNGKWNIADQSLTSNRPWHAMSALFRTGWQTIFRRSEKVHSTDWLRLDDDVVLKIALFEERWHFIFIAVMILPSKKEVWWWRMTSTDDTNRHSSVSLLRWRRWNEKIIARILPR